MLTENEIDGRQAHALRVKAGLSQSAFWTPLGVHQAVGCRYENGSVKIPRPVRRLMVLRYVAGMEIDVSTPEGVAELESLARVMNSRRAARTETLTAKASVRAAMKNLERASDVLETL